MTAAIHVFTPLPYIYRWDKCGRKGQQCKVTARGTMNSCCVEFADGFKMITSRNALRRYPAPDTPQQQNDENRTNQAENEVASREQ